jgi:hypothetical protein
LLFSGALIDQSPKAHHPSTAAEAWEKVEIICHHLPIMTRKNTTATQQRQHQCCDEEDDDDNDGHDDLRQTSTFHLAPFLQKTYDASVQQKFEAILEERNQHRRSYQQHHHPHHHGLRRQIG